MLSYKNEQPSSRATKWRGDPKSSGLLQLLDCFVVLMHFSQ
ncbi:hypothetical protein [Candidatus Tisiphia endosymbiont of Oplodontha viridula]